jgi:tetratricopeptide (TPR) repeat protein
MGDSRPLDGAPEPVLVPDVFLLPLAVPEVLDHPGLDAGLLARRLPDFLHQLLNGVRGQQVGMLEIQPPPGATRERWVTLSEPPEPDEVFPMFADDEPVRAIVGGTLRYEDEILVMDLTVHSAPGEVDAIPCTIHSRIRLDEPVRSMVATARHLARALDLPFPEPATGLLTSNAAAFFRYLEGLEGAAILGGDGGRDESGSGERLVRQFTEALRLDPHFGMALRTAAMTLFVALEGDRVRESTCYGLIDRCYDLAPADGEGCVVVAEHLALLGDDDRAVKWLRHAARLDPPSPRALESLGVVLANRGELVSARDLWLRGIESDGHPDFFAHLARLGFAESQDSEAWDKVLRGLRRKYERAVRAREWPTEPRSGSVLLRYLSEHLEEREAPEDVVEALLDLAGTLTEPEENVDLGLCLLRAGHAEEAAEELARGIAGELPPSTQDRAVRAQLAIEIRDFERRFAAASERASRGRDPRSALTEMQHYLDVQPAFWPALFFAGVALRRLGHADQALDLMAEVLSRRPGQGDALLEMARLFDDRGNPKRALECIDDAIGLEPEDAELHVLRAQFLERLDRRPEAALALERAIELEPERPDHRRRWRRLAAS